jgi:hypothetical protein
MADAAKGLNRITICNPAPCHQVLSEQNARIVVQAVTSAEETLGQIPSGWRAVMDTAIRQIETYLDDYGKSKFLPYIEAARVVLNNLVKGGQ